MERGQVIIAKFGWNDITKRPFEFKYEFGYYVDYGAVVYKEGESNFQDSALFKLGEIRLATEEDKENYYWAI